MQDPPGSSSNTTGEISRLGGGVGLARFRSAPATWLDALLEDDDPLKLSGPHHHHHQHHQQGSLTQLLTSAGPSVRPGYVQPEAAADPGFFEEEGGGAQGSSTTTNTNTAAFQRMNSSPADFLSSNIDGYFSSYGIPASSYEFAGGGGSSLDISPLSGKRLRESDSERSGEQGGLLTTANSLVEMEMDKLLEDSVPCRVRAKRGCATHPRSIAERVRRTRISDRIRKLQELVPNMDKQTNTADMLEEAVEYVKNLQRQIQELTEQQKKCKCIAKS